MKRTKWHVDLLWYNSGQHHCLTSRSWVQIPMRAGMRITISVFAELLMSCLHSRVLQWGSLFSLSQTVRRQWETTAHISLGIGKGSLQRENSSKLVKTNKLRRRRHIIFSFPNEKDPNLNAISFKSERFI